MATSQRNTENKAAAPHFAPTGSRKFSVVNRSTINQKPPSADGHDVFVLVSLLLVAPLTSDRDGDR
jgi:hypothetical protein